MATAGKLLVTVVEARVEKDLNTFGDMDPYVEIEHRMERFKTKVVKNGGKEPQFNEQFTYDVKYIGDDFTMRLMNKNTIMQDELMGETIIKISSLCIPDFDDWYQVSVKGVKAGAIRFRAEWQPRESQTHNAELAEKEAELEKLKQQQMMQGMQMQQMNNQMMMNNGGMMNPGMVQPGFVMPPP